MAKSQETIFILEEGVDSQLEKIHDEYMENAPGVNWTKRGVLSHMDTWRIDSTKPLLLQQSPDGADRGKKKARENNVMLDQGLAYFMPYELFTYPEILNAIALRHNPQGFMIRAYKEQKKDEDESKYHPNTFLDYSIGAILNSFVVLDDQNLHVKKSIVLKKEKHDFYQNEGEMINWMDERYVGFATKVQYYNIYPIVIQTYPSSSGSYSRVSDPNRGGCENVL